MLLALPLAASADTADIIAPSNPEEPTVDSGWQAGTCKDDGPPVCSVDTPDKFFEQAGGHPPIGFTQFIVKTKKNILNLDVPVGSIKTVRVDLPRGLSVNPQSTPQCALAAGESPSSCPANTQVGVSNIAAVVLETGLAIPIPNVPVYNIVPKEGEPARFGLSPLPGTDVYLEADVAWEGDYHEYFTIHLEEVLGGLARVSSNRLSFNGRSGAGDETFLTTPTTCFDPTAPATEHLYSTYLRADSFEIPDPSFPFGSGFFESPLPPGTGPKACADIPYEPALNLDPQVAATDSPAGAATVVEVPEINGGENLASSHTRRGEVRLPEGMGLNPSAAPGLAACTDAQLGKGTRNPVACPPASRIGSAAIETPPLPDGALTGTVYLGSQRSSDPASGQLYRIFVVAESARYDISARLVGNVKADPRTGQITAVFDDPDFGGLPQVPFSSLTIDLDGGPRATLTSPPTCGPNASRATMTPWSGNPAASADDSFVLSSAPGGGACAPTRAARPFAPGFAARASTSAAGAHTQVAVSLSRADGEQELKVAGVSLPPGMTAKLAGIPYCPEAAIATAAVTSGAAERAHPSCPAASRVGSADVRAGSGPLPYQTTGTVYLAGPRAGAPLSLAIVTPATAGPLDLGSVVVRVPVFLDRRTARVTAVTEALPHVFGGALLDIRSAEIKLDRPGFSLNPTNCTPYAFDAGLRGGGANPLDPNAFSSAYAQSPFQATGCRKLRFRPKLYLRLFGATRRAKNPKLRAVLDARRGDANIRRAVVTLPKGLILDQSSIARVCTRVQFAAKACPRNSRYGWARAFTPLLDKPLAGPVYLRSSDNKLPDLVASLNGQVGVDLVGRIDAVKGRIRNSFTFVPDVPIKRFILTVKGGRKGLLTNTRRLCGKKKMRAVVRLRAHNDRKANSRPNVRRPCGKKKRRHGRR